MKESAAQRMLDILRSHRLLLTVSLQTADDWQGLSEFLELAQLHVVEIMLRSPHAWEGLRHLRKHRPRLGIGIGTVLDPDDLKRARDAGADFAVSPGSTAALLEAAWDIGLPYLPGVATASDLMLVARTPFRAVKFFPAVALGPDYLQALRAPFPDFQFCVAGGLKSDNIASFLEAGQVLALSGGWLLPENLGDAQARDRALPHLKQLICEVNEAFATQNPGPSNPADA